MRLNCETYAVAHGEYSREFSFSPVPANHRGPTVFTSMQEASAMAAQYGARLQCRIRREYPFSITMWRDVIE